jgi:hypothetical protein
MLAEVNTGNQRTKTSTGIVSVPVEIQNENLPNTYKSLLLEPMESLHKDYTINRRNVYTIIACQLRYVK